MSDISILPFDKSRADHFRSINEEWIAQMFTLEPLDVAVLSDPQTHILDHGGDILFAAVPDLGIVGTGALKPWDNGDLELTKMGVLEKARGRGIGEPLLRALIRRGEEMAPGRVFLLTNSRCEAAIHLYERNGFEHDAALLESAGRTYCRCDVGMRYTGA
ncbi:GNAT family N-acetyltransferase [Parvularcula sp. LCG005]|uniref:GNAT family N-acetyltransferase n=1 Tax=Parvularcula sp. LCG005 TaxID=3078805 RepID=UPI002942A134|nr:GNAT family N-acetyltransferase [Parvularcula sp. LCG005]WOI54069.1 GNAT family N-acetyltransferase [Parvularcula sp. LCG005]